MKKYAFNELSLMQYVMLIHGAQFGIGVLELPRTVAETAGTDGWMSVLIGWAIALLVSAVILQIMKRHPDDTLFDLFRRYFGKVIGGTGIVLYVVYYLFTAIMILLTTVFLLKVWILPKTPFFMLMFLLMIPTYLLVRNGVRVIGRYAELVFILALWMMIFLWIPLKDSHWLHFLPFFKGGWMKLALSVKTTVFSYSGFELAFFLYPFLKEKQKAWKGMVIANSMTMVVFVSVTIVCFAYFSPYEITQYRWPTLNLLKVVEFRFIERIEIVYLAFYLFVMSRTWVPVLYVVAFGTGQLMGKRDHRSVVPIYLALIVLLTLFFTPSYTVLQKLQKVFGTIGIVLGYGFPFILWGYVAAFDAIKRRKAR
ncbi:MAG: GerAB/ArcD/ProY family transporter [Tumebacillaceae bacterium]